MNCLEPYKDSNIYAKCSNTIQDAYKNIEE